MANAPLLPIKLVVAHKDDYRANDQPRNTGFDPIVKVTSELRTSLSGQIAQVASHFAPQFNRWQSVPAVATVKLRAEAVCKSKRPFGVFNNNTCPVIGGVGLGTLHVSVTRERLGALGDKIERGESDREVSHISTIQSIMPYGLTDAIGEASLSELDNAAREGESLRLRLFRHHRPTADQAIVRAFESLSGTAVDQIRRLNYAEGVDVFEVSPKDVRGIATLASFPGTRGLHRFDTFHVAQTAANVLRSLPRFLLTGPEADQEYPLVGLIDTGTDPQNAALQAWVEDRWDVVPADIQEHSHGSFVAGLVAAGRSLNHDDPRFPSCAAKIIDVAAFDEDGRADERDLIRIIKEAVRRYPKVRVWNLSFALISQVCINDDFSMLGLVLAELSRKHGVVFVVAAGNREIGDMQGWPRISDPTDRDRICSPADCPTAVVVGSLAHRETVATCVRAEEPSPFTRRGPGGAYLMAPHVMHYGGNCKDDGSCIQAGVMSVDGLGNLAEDSGTSFASPSTAALIANVMSSLRDEDAPDVLAKAMTVHSAMLRNSVIDPAEFHHCGVGPTGDLSDILNCRQDAATLVLQADLGVLPKVVKEHFPMPPCLITEGSLRGEILMTLAYSPPLDPDAGFELCQTNVDAMLGTVHPIRGAWKTQVKSYPTMQEEGWEAQLVKNGFKWSPLKIYRRIFDRKNAVGGWPWELRLKLQRRAALREIDGTHHVYLLITVRSLGSDPDHPLPIYNEMVRGMNALGWNAIDLQVRVQERAR